MFLRFEEDGVSIPGALNRNFKLHIFIPPSELQSDYRG